MTKILYTIHSFLWGAPVLLMIIGVGDGHLAGVVVLLVLQHRLHGAAGQHLELIGHGELVLIVDEIDHRGYVLHM